MTGQEQRRIRGARHLACTVEMASTTRPVDVAVIDEVPAADQILVTGLISKQCWMQLT